MADNTPVEYDGNVLFQLLDLSTELRYIRIQGGGPYEQNRLVLLATGLNPVSYTHLRAHET